MHGSRRLFVLVFVALVGRARAEIVPPQLAASLAAAQEAADEKKRDACSPRSETERGQFGRSVTVYRQVEYDLQIGEVTAATAELRRRLASWVRGQSAAVRACLPAPALMQAPERLAATVHLLLQGKRVRSAAVLSADPPAPPRRPGVDVKCIEQALLSQPELGLKAPSPMVQASIELRYAPFCVIWREYENPPPSPSPAVGYGRGKSRHLMPAAPPPPPPAGAT